MRHAPTGITEREYQDFRLIASDMWSVINQLPDLPPAEALDEAQRMKATGTDDADAVAPNVVLKVAPEGLSVVPGCPDAKPVDVGKSLSCPGLASNKP